MSHVSTTTANKKFLEEETTVLLSVLFNKFIYLFLLCWVFAARAFLWWRWAGAHLELYFFSRGWLFLFRNVASRERGLQWFQHVGSMVAAPGLLRTGVIAAAHRLRHLACGIFPSQGSNLRLLHWQVGSTTEPSRKPQVLLMVDCCSFWRQHADSGDWEEAKERCMKW